MNDPLRLGDYNLLRVVRKVDFGMYLDGGPEGDILLPSRYVPQNLKVGDETIHSKELNATNIPKPKLATLPGSNVRG